MKVCHVSLNALKEKFHCVSLPLQFLYTLHCLKGVQSQSFFWSVFSRIWTEYGDL